MSLKKKGIIGSVSTVMIVLIIVKIIGFLKQAIIAAYFGTSGEMDIFLLVSELMENIGSAIFSAISVSFLTLYVKTMHKDGRKGANQLTSNMIAVFIPCVMFLAVLIIIFSNQIAWAVAPGYQGVESQTVAKYIKYFAITVLNMFISYTCTAILESEKKFIPGKLVGILRSVCMITACIFFSDKLGIDALLISILVYYLFESIYLILCIRKKLKLCFSSPWKDTRVWYLLKLSGPLFISYGCIQLQGIVDKAVGSGLPEGSITTLSFSNYIFSMVHSIVVGSICTVLFSYFTSYVAKEQHGEVLNTLYKYIRITIILLLPITIMFIGYSYDIIDVVYGRGAFSEAAISNTAIALSAYSIGLIFIGIRDLLIRAHYAYQDTKKVMLNGVWGVIINIILSITLSKFIGLLGIALATSISSLCIAVLSCRTVKRHMPDFKIFSLGSFFLLMAVTGVIGTILVVISNAYIELGNVFLNLFLKCILYIAVYAVVLKLLHCSEIIQLEQGIRKKFKR